MYTEQGGTEMKPFLVSDINRQVHHVLSGRPGGGTVVYLERVGAMLEFRCHHCKFRRQYATEKGAVHRITEHLLREHRIKAVWS